MLFAGCMTASVISFAQVKVGTNLGNIGSTSNLEVEASTTGRKTVIDKTTGQLTVKDGTEEAGEVFTSDANGNGSWVAGGASQVNFFAYFTGAKSFPSNLKFDTATPNVGNGYDVVNDRFTAPVAGIYYFVGTCYIDCTGGTGVYTDYKDIMSIMVNYVPKITQEQFPYTRSLGNAFSISYLTRLNQGDVVELYGYTTKPGARSIGYSSSFDVPQTTFQAFLNGN